MQGKLISVDSAPCVVRWKRRKLLRQELDRQVDDKARYEAAVLELLQLYSVTYGLPVFQPSLRAMIALGPQIDPEIIKELLLLSLPKTRDTLTPD